MALRLEHVTRRFGRQLGLDDLSLWARRGECYGFLGPNGAGKTTALRIAVGLSRPSAGRVFLLGLALERWPREARARVGALIEVPGFHGSWSGARNLVALARLAGKGRAEARAESERLLVLVGLAEVGAKPVQAYSHGMRQRLGIAQALIGGPQGGPELLLLDEPTNGLDPEGIAEVRGLLARLVSEEGLSVVISSHQLAEIASLVQRVGLLRRGRLLVEARFDALVAAGEERYRLVARDPERAARTLAELGLEAHAHEDEPGALGIELRSGALRVDLGGREPESIARALVEAGAGLVAFAPEPTSLEEIYLRHTRSEAEGTRGVAEPAELARETERAPARLSAVAAVLRVARYEITRWSSGSAAAFCALAPLVVASIALWRRRAEALEHAREVAGAEVFSTTDVTAFEGLGVALSAGLPLCAWLVLGLASQQLAGELARGTLRNMLLRPLTRLDVALGKALALGLYVLAAWAALATASLVLAGVAFDYGDVVEVLPNGATFPLVAAADLWPELRTALVSPLLPLAAFGALGLAASAVTRTGAGALGLALAAGLVLDLGRVLVRGLALERWLPSAHLPSPLGDSSFLRTYLDLAEGVSNAAPAPGASAVLVPVAWIFALVAIASLVLARRSVP